MNQTPGMAAALRTMAQTAWWRVPLGFTLTVAFVSLATFWLPNPLRTVVTLICMAGLWVLLFYMASRLLIQEMTGARRQQERNAVNVPDGLALRHVVLWIGLSLILAMMDAALGLSGLLAAGLVLALVLPGATLVLVSGNSLVDALYPPEWLRFFRELGPRDYIALSGWLVLFSILYVSLAGVLSEAPIWVRNALQMGWWSFGLLAWSACAGMLLHAHRIAPPSGPTPKGPETAAPSDLFDQVMEQGADVIKHRKLARVLTAAGETDLALAHAQVHIPALLMTFDRPVEALEQADRLLVLDGDFCLRDPVLMRLLIQTSRRTAPAALTVSLCRNYLKSFPASLVRAEVALTACEALAEADILEEGAGQAWLETVAQEELDTPQRSRLEVLRGSL